MTRLFINIFFIVIICFTLSVLPINTAALEMLDLDSMFSSNDQEPEEEIIPVDESFTPEFSVEFLTDHTERLYNPTSVECILKTNIPSEYEKSYDFDDITLTLYQNDEIFQTINGDKIIQNKTLRYENETIVIDYVLEMDFYKLELNRDGFFKAEFAFADDKELAKQTYDIAYRPTIQYVNNGSAQNNGNFTYKTFFKNETGTHLVPAYISVPYPESITVEVRDRLYNPPPLGYGLSTEKVIPEKSSISKLGDKYYGVFMYTEEINKVINNEEEAKLAIDALVQSLIRLPHIERLTFFVDDQQLEGALYNIDLTTIYEQTTETYVYLSEKNSTDKRYLIPIKITEESVYDEILSIFNTLKTGKIHNKQWMQIVPPDVEMITFLIEGTTITADFNEAFLTAYDDAPEYKRMMINSILYSFTSNPNINKVVMTVNGQTVNNYAGYNFTEPQLEPAYINFIGDY